MTGDAMNVGNTPTNDLAMIGLGPEDHDGAVIYEPVWDTLINEGSA